MQYIYKLAYLSYCMTYSHFTYSYMSHFAYKCVSYRYMHRMTVG